MFSFVPASSNRTTDLYTAAIRSGLGGNLQLVLDAGSGTSVTASDAQWWRDLSGNGYDFYLGSSTATGADEPVFAGTIGGLSSNENWTFTSATVDSWFEYDSANETWMNNLHKQNASFTALFWLNVGSLASSGGVFFGTNGLTGFGNNGVQLIFSPNELTFGASAATASANAFTATSDSTLASGTWHLVGISIDEAVGASGGFFYDNGSYIQSGAADKFDCTYNFTAASNATYTMRLTDTGDGSTLMGEDHTLAGAMFWSAALTKEQIDVFYNKTKARFGL